MQRYGVFKFNASIILIICVKSMLYNIYLFFSYVFEPKTTVFMAFNFFQPMFCAQPLKSISKTDRFES